MGLFELILIAVGLSMGRLCRFNLQRLEYAAHELSPGRDHRPVLRRFPGADAGHRLVSRQTI